MNNFIPLQINDLIEHKDVNLHVALGGLNENLTLEEIENINRNVFYLKIASIIIISGITILFGLMPYLCQKYNKNVKLLGFANAFSGGLFMGIALFHLLPESNEAFEHFFVENDPNSKWKNLPCSFFLAFISYASILFIEKVAFDSHALTAHNHAEKKDDHDDTTLVYDADQKEFIDKSLNEPLFKQINQNNNDIPNTKTFKEDKEINKVKPNKDKITTAHDDHNHGHDHKHPHNPVHIHNQHHDHSKNDIIDMQKNMPNVDNFLLNESENRDNFDSSPEEDKTIIRPRGNTFDHPKISYSQIRKNLNGDAFNEKKKNKKKKKSKILDANCAHDHSHIDQSDSDIEEATLKNVVSTKGKFVSLLQARNICINFTNIN